MEDGGVQAAGRDQHQLETEDRTRTELGGVGREHQGPGQRHQPEAGARPREQVPGEGGDGNTAGQTEQAQVEHRRGADEQRDPRDVGDLNGGVQPEPLAHRVGERRGLEPREPVGRRMRQRNSTVLLPMVIRSARISPASVRFG